MIKHEWNGTVLTITSDSGTSSADLKGAKGDDGIRGAQGIPGSGYTLTEGDMATIMEMVMANISQEASGISYADTHNVGSDNVQDALDAAFQLGTNRKAELISSLQYSNLGLNTSNSWQEIFNALAARFPDAIYDLLSTWTPDGINAGSDSESKVSRDDEEVTFTAYFANGHTAYCETAGIPVGNYQNMRITGTASCGAGSVGHTPTVTIVSNGVVLHSFSIPNGESADFTVSAVAADNLKISIYGRYQEASAKFKIYLYN